MVTTNKKKAGFIFLLIILLPTSYFSSLLVLSLSLFFLKQMMSSLMSSSLTNLLKNISMVNASFFTSVSISYHIQRSSVTKWRQTWMSRHFWTTLSLMAFFGPPHLRTVSYFVAHRMSGALHPRLCSFPPPLSLPDFVLLPGVFHLFILFQFFFLVFKTQISHPLP